MRQKPLMKTIYFSALIIITACSTNQKTTPNSNSKATDTTIIANHIKQVKPVEKVENSVKN